MSRPIVRAILILAALTFRVISARAAGTAGNAEVRKLITAAMEDEFLDSNFEAADKKLTQAEAICKRKGCSSSVHASIFGYFAIVDWVADQDRQATIDDLKSMLEINPQQKLDADYAPPEMKAMLKKAQAELRAAPPPEPQAREVEERRTTEAEERAAAARLAAEAARTAEEERRESARRAAEENKEHARSAADEAHRAAEERKEAARRAAEDRKESARSAAEEARRAAEEKREAARAAAEEKKEAARHAAEEARKAAEERKEAARAAAEEKKEAARAAAEEKKEAARKAAEEKKEAARKAAEDARKAAEEKKEAARKAVEDARKAAEEKKEAARKAAEEKKAEDARKAEEARKAEIDKRMRVPPPVGKLIEEPWKGQAVDYPIQVRVKLPPPPPRIEPERVAVVKVVTEYSGPGVAVPAKVELKATKPGEFEGTLSCDVSKQEGEVTYYTTAYNQYDNIVASGGTMTKPNKVPIKAELVSALAHMPGELPPQSCTDSERLAKAQQPKCAGDAGCANAPVCEGAECGGADPASKLTTAKARGRGCAGCHIGAADAPLGWGAFAGLGLILGHLAHRRSARARRSAGL